LTRPPSISGALVMLETSLARSQSPLIDCRMRSDSLNLDARLSDHASGASTPEEAESEPLEPLGEGEEALLVIDGKQRCEGVRECSRASHGAGGYLHP
jgi:hypothetical protein